MKNQEEIAREIGVDFQTLHEFIIRPDRQYPIAQKSLFAGWQFEDSVAEQIAKEYQEFVRAEKKSQESAASILLVAGMQVPGYRIDAYSEWISAEGVVQIERNVDTGLEEAVSSGFARAREHALARLKREAVQLECNAILGVTVQYVNMPTEKSGQSMSAVILPQLLCVSISGTAVRLVPDAD